ncbi:2-amino-4-hydroxy-6-hydroxymethyldihydropteridine diphosphokinase [Pedobacter punctiformis]|uniref:2-amino-4-hydroxy-6-hydroxymethyldihydropteridine pyrophosphokinase n=1 Tax=Pedobacter punctiformis TaxID=3004097 RepID=A0ABT4L8S1_9SPHI|nr:2-amino-4-hydroxy-6-hydroxymethyldihydropteridine diphosphokinase [Pedobacter sp. HCMS5-2]MCZ4244310.1 2-amino-4-hydroxy-6-hydroxymethyldihydropteridine diphosphokinase [Pedobacter sp. HCMS5-2]
MALDSTIAYLLLGGNLGNREDNLQRTIELLAKEIGEVVAKSSIYETAAWGKTDQPSFLNQAVGLKTNLSAIEVLEKALEIEKNLGRVRKEKWGERLIDIDLILFGDEIINIENKLHVPHPQMQFRKFVMEPLAEIAPQVVHPLLKQTILEILENIVDDLDVKKL